MELYKTIILLSVLQGFVCSPPEKFIVDENVTPTRQHATVNVKQIDLDHSKDEANTVLATTADADLLLEISGKKKSSRYKMQTIVLAERLKDIKRQNDTLEAALCAVTVNETVCQN